MNKNKGLSHLLKYTQYELAGNLSNDYFEKPVYKNVAVEDDQFPKPQNNYFRKTHESDIGELHASALSKIRRYIQIKPGKLNWNFTEAWLEGVTLVRERTDVGIQIEAAPPNSFFPFGALVSSPHEVRYCGKEAKMNSLLQAAGNEWGVSTQHKLDYVGCIFDKNVFSETFEVLTGQALPENLLISDQLRVDTKDINYCTQWIQRTLLKLDGEPALQNDSNFRRLLSSIASQVATRLLISSDHIHCNASPSRRLKGVRRAVDYLLAYAHLLPTIPELCKVSQLSERSLQYGFQEQFGVTPVQYLRLVRLNGARLALSKAIPGTTSVTEIALAWGFYELGRFSGEYLKLFNELPSITLRARTEKQRPLPSSQA